MDANCQELVQILASRYTEALKAVNAQIAAGKDKDKGLVAKAMDAKGPDPEPAAPAGLVRPQGHPRIREQAENIHTGPYDGAVRVWS